MNKEVKEIFIPMEGLIINNKHTLKMYIMATKDPQIERIIQTKYNGERYGYLIKYTRKEKINE